MNETQFTVTVFVGLLLIASGVSMLTKWVRLPYTLALVIIGLIISPMHFLPVVHVSPELILLIFLPALLFEAAWNLNLKHLRENLLPILSLALLGVIFSVGIIGLILHVGIHLSWSSAFLFGAMISATDPISVLAIFKRLGLPARLTTIVEGESLLNDGTAAVLFKIILGVVIGASAGGTSDLIWGSLREFAIVVFGGILIGAAVGILASTLTSYFDDYLLEITLTTIAAYGTFLGAETLHVSAVIAVLVTGLVIGNYGRHRGMSPTTQIAVNSFWEYAAFVVNSLVFLLIGLEIQVAHLLDNIASIGWGVVAVIAARGAVVYGLTTISNHISDPIPARWKPVIFWGGLRGSLSIALVLSLPRDLDGRELLVVMIFGTVIFSLLFQGLTISGLLKALGLSQPEAKAKEYEIIQGRLFADTAAQAELDTLKDRGLITRRIYRELQKQLGESTERLTDQLAEFDDHSRNIENELFDRIRRHLLNVKKARLSELVRDRLLSESVYHELNKELDRSLGNREEDSGKEKIEETRPQTERN
jgi:CPA1 family monovalent cation:H+ antiporter